MCLCIHVYVLICVYVLYFQFLNGNFLSVYQRRCCFAMWFIINAHAMPNPIRIAKVTSKEATLKMKKAAGDRSSLPKQR